MATELEKEENRGIGKHSEKFNHSEKILRLHIIQQSKLHLNNMNSIP